jgi:trigger factor
VDDLLIGKKEGEILDIPQPYPATHPDARLSGKTVIFRVKIGAIKQKKLPPLDDEFAKDCGPYQSLEELKEKLRGEMERVLKKDIEETYKEAIIKRLVETHHFEVPETLVERELSAMVQQNLDVRRRKKPDAVAVDDPLKRQDEIKRLRDEYLPEAKRRVKVGLILEAIAEKESLRVEEKDISAELSRLANGLKLSPEEVRRMVHAGGEDMAEELKSRILADKSLDFVYRHAVIQG